MRRASAFAGQGDGSFSAAHAPVNAAKGLWGPSSHAFGGTGCRADGVESTDQLIDVGAAEQVFRAVGCVVRERRLVERSASMTPASVRCVTTTQTKSIWARL